MRDLSKYADNQLLSLVKSGSEEAFSILFERYRSRLFYYLLRHTKSAEIAEEIVIDIFVKLWKGREMADQIGEPSAFFHKVGYFKALDFLRAAGRSKRLQEIYCKRATEQVRLPDELLIDAETRSLILRAIDQLPPQRKLIYQLSRDEGLTHEEIADKLNLSKSTVNNTIVTASRSVTEYIRKASLDKAALSLWFFM